jgi:hypothetical protein
MTVDDEASPIASDLAGDPAQHERLERFVVALGERVDRLQDLETLGDAKQLEADARSLGYDATQHGYPALARAALGVERACAGASRAAMAGAMRESVRALTGVARRVRLGHRGAASY